MNKNGETQQPRLPGINLNSYLEKFPYPSSMYFDFMKPQRNSNDSSFVCLPQNVTGA